MCSTLLVLLTLTIADDKKSDEEGLQGTWVMQSLEVEGKLVPEEKIKGTMLTIKGDKYVSKVRKTEHEVTFKLDPKQKPKHIDMFFPDGPDVPKLARGIYELDRDTFRMCRAQATGEDRPKDFLTEGVTGRFIVTWKRQK